MSETKEPKIARKGVLFALGIICIILVACLAGVVAAYALVISRLNSSVANLQNQVASDNATINSLTSEVTNLQKQLLDPYATYTVVGTLSFANTSAINEGIIVAYINPSFYPNLSGSFMYLIFNGQLASTLPINGWTIGSMVAINGTISFDSFLQTYFLNWINGSLYGDTAEALMNRLGLQLTMALQKTKYSLGESISITLTITNISNETRNFEMGPSVNDFDFHVYNDTNSSIYWYSSHWVGEFMPYYVVFETLNAGESLNCTLVWQQTFSQGLDSEALPVSPGTYYIVGSVGPPFSYGENSTMETTPVQITIG